MNGWLIAGIVIVVIVILWVIRNLIKTKNSSMIHADGSGAGVKNFLMRCCGRGRY